MWEREIDEDLLDVFCASTDSDPEIAALLRERDDLLAAAESRRLRPRELVRLSDIMTEAVVRTAEVCAGLFVDVCASQLHQVREQH